MIAEGNIGLSLMLGGIFTGGIYGACYGLYYVYNKVKKK